MVGIAFEKCFEIFARKILLQGKVLLNGQVLKWLHNKMKTLQIVKITFQRDELSPECTLVIVSMNQQFVSTTGTCS